jgi:hypothetical protein
MKANVGSNTIFFIYGVVFTFLGRERARDKGEGGKDAPMCLWVPDLSFYLPWRVTVPCLSRERDPTKSQTHTPLGRYARPCNRQKYREIKEKGAKGER